MSLEQMSGDDEPIVLGELDPEPENMFFDHWPAQFHQDS